MIAHNDAYLLFYILSVYISFRVITKNRLFMIMAANLHIICITFEYLRNISKMDRHLVFLYHVYVEYNLLKIKSMQINQLKGSNQKHTISG